MQLNSTADHLGWLGIVRLGLVQTALGAIIVLTTSTLNRVMVVELALPAILPGALVAAHYAVQMLRPRLGYGSDIGGRRTPWIVGGMIVLGLGAIGASLATSLMATSLVAGIVLATVAFLAIGVGVGASGTTLLVLISTRVAVGRRPAAATIVWVMMIVGFVITAGVAGRLLDPYSPGRLVAVVTGISIFAVLLTLIAVRGVEGRAPAAAATVGSEPRTGFRDALRQVWAERAVRHFTVFVFVSMLAYSMQDLILEPFAGIVFGLSVGETTRLSGVQNSGVLVGMAAFAVFATRFRARWFGSTRVWMVGGCLASGLALLALAAAASVGPAWPLKTTVFFLGFSNGAFAVAAIGSMMVMVGAGRKAREGVRMGLWGASQAIAFGLGGLVGTGLADIASHILASRPLGYAIVLVVEAALFVAAAGVALRIEGYAARQSAPAGLAFRQAPERS